MQHRVRFNKKRFIRSLTLTISVILLVSIGFGIVSGFISNASPTLTYTQYRVKTGDTLWSIAKDYASDFQDIRFFIYQIKTTNQLATATIYPGQMLQIPLGGQ